MKFLLNTVARIAALAAAAYIAAIAPDNRTKSLVYGGAALLIVISEYVGIYRPMVNLEELRKKQMDLIFKPLLTSSQLAATRVKLRANVMLIRRHWIFWKHFFQFYQQGMTQHPDANLHFSIKKGFCGQVLRESEQRVRYVNLIETPWVGEWSAAEAQKVAHVKAIAVVPLVREVKTWRGNSEWKYFGCLNVDATDPAGAQVLADPEIQRQIAALGEIVEVTYR